MLLLQLFESLKMGFAVSKIGWIDLAVIIAIVGGSVIGYTRGLADQITRFLALIVTVVVTLHYYERISTLITSNSGVPPVFASMTVFFLVAAVTNVVTKLLLMVTTRLMTIQFVYFLERVFGAILGAIRFVLLFGMISVFAALPASPTITKLYAEESLTGPIMLKMCPFVHDYSMYFAKAIVSGFKREEKPQP